ncbi:MAG: relaxase domain-containing protein, partial [Mycolicibacterium sp.]|nr:relaxase domain-containing protein [Mycolicibacterium sp.]
MNAGIHKLTAGDGYLYLTRTVAAGDATNRGRMSLDDYYSSKGESPGRWMGRGLASLEQPAGRELRAEDRHIWRVEAGSQVTEDQMKALFGLGMHPNADKIVTHLVGGGAPKAAGLAAAKLGREFTIRDGASELQRRLARAYQDYNEIRGLHYTTPIDDEVQAQFRTRIGRELFAKEYGRQPSDDRELSGFIAREEREPTTSVAGYDVTFTMPKSVSVLWALAEPDVARVIEDCHERAVADALEFLQEQATFTRTGAGGVAQIDTDGLIAASFVHRDSRAGDPHLHTHCPVSNKVHAVGADGIGRWLALDGRPFYKSIVAASELHNTRLEAYLIADLGLSFVERAPLERGKRPVREIAEMPIRLIESFSTRLHQTEARFAALAKEFHATHGREPTAKESRSIYQRAQLDTRQAKHEPRSLTEQRAQWRDEAIKHLGSVVDLVSMLGKVLSTGRQVAPAVTQAWIKDQAAAAVETVSGTRSVWQRTHVFAEAQRLVRAHNLHAEPQLAERITDVALRDLSMEHARDLDADLGEPELLRRRDGSSIYSTHGTQLYTSAAVVAAERRILAAAQRTDGRRVDEQAVGLALLESCANGRELNAGQETLVRKLACSGARVELALAPAGTGKTTAMAVLARAWAEDGGTVIGLASSANAAQLLRNDMAGQGVTIDVDTIDKLAWLVANPKVRDDPARRWFNKIGRNTLIIVDEAGKAGTLALDAVISAALARGASVRLVGDNKQLSSISAGGILTDIEHTVGAATVTEVMRFESDVEAAATLGLREGDPTALAFYADHHRIHVTSEMTAADMAFDAWVADLAHGTDSLLLAPTNETVTALNARGRSHRLATADAGLPGPEVTLADGLQASVGDIVCTRKNWRGLRLGGGRDFVRNGYRWRVAKVHRNGALTVTHLESGQRVKLPAGYIPKHTTLGYASTIDAAQGSTVNGTCHMVGSDTLTRQQTYTGLSRARFENHVYFGTAEIDPHRVLSEKALHPPTGMEVLTQALGRDDAQVSATTAERQATDPFRRLGPASARYLDAVGQAAEAEVNPAALARIDGADTVYAGLTSEPAWPTLRRHLAILALAGADPIEQLKAAVARRELETAVDVAAVLDWRLDYTGAHSMGNGPLPWLPNIPKTLQQHPSWGEYLGRRAALVAELADHLSEQATAWTRSTTPAWARPLMTLEAKNAKPLAVRIAIFRAAVGVADTDSTLTGPPQYAVRTHRMQQLLADMAQEFLGREEHWEISRLHEVLDQIDTRLRSDGY